MEFKNILKELRLERSLTQKEVAQNCDLSPQCISQLEMGTRNPTGSTLELLADYFDCSIDYLMGRDKTEIHFKPIKFSNEEKSQGVVEHGPHLSTEEWDWLELYHALKDEKGEKALHAVKTIIETFLQASK